MSLSSIRAVVVFLGMLLPARGAGAQGVTAADSASAYARPSELLDVPGAVREQLERLGCSVPRHHWGVSAVEGSFLGAGRRDWAAMCSRHGRSAILVFDSRRQWRVQTVERDMRDGIYPAPRESDDESDSLRRERRAVFVDFGILRARAEDIEEAIARGDSATVKVRGMPASEWIGDHVLTPPERRLPVHDGIRRSTSEGESDYWYWTGRRWMKLLGPG